MSAKTNATLHVTADNFEQEVLATDRPALVDFHAAWCAPCRILGPTIDEIADEYAGRAVVAKVDVDAAPSLAQRYGVQSIPTLLVVKDGEVIAKRIGIAPKGDLTDLLDQAIA
ncbi:MAG: thioredoxin [Phycisphaerales bacterium]